jgi:signal transduction histidine kinase
MTSIFPAHWPVRWRIAAVSAGLTFLILLAFALVVGRLASDKLKNDFRDELQSTTDQMSSDLQLYARLGDERAERNLRRPLVEGVFRIVDSNGTVYEVWPPDAPDLGTPQPEQIVSVGDLDVAAQRLAAAPAIGQPTYYVQHAESRDSIESTISRLWLLLGLGVLGGTALAALAGVAVAQRAMNPITALTKAAREVAATRDPSRRLPEPETDDEVAELARTLGEMLRELDAARTEKEQMIQAQREFVADASHELRTPLTSILANLELLQARLADRSDDGEDAEIVAGALGSSRRMRRLVADLLLLARADAGRGGSRQPADLTEIAATAIGELRSVSELHSIGLEADGPVTANVNGDDIHRLLANLIENAIRHTPAGTNVAVRVRREGDEALIEVTDDGPGLPAGLGDQIFGRFVRGGGPADVSAGGGTGLGLAIVKAVAAAHGGEVQAGTATEGGARFTVRIPASDERPVPVRPVEPPGRAPEAAPRKF